MFSVPSTVPTSHMTAAWTELFPPLRLVGTNITPISQTRKLRLESAAGPGPPSLESWGWDSGRLFLKQMCGATVPHCLSQDDELPPRPGRGGPLLTGQGFTGPVGHGPWRFTALEALCSLIPHSSQHCEGGVSKAVALTDWTAQRGEGACLRSYSRAAKPGRTQAQAAAPTRLSGAAALALTWAERVQLILSSEEQAPGDSPGLSFLRGRGRRTQ